MAEQAQSDADDLDGLQEVALDATQDQTDPSTNCTEILTDQTTHPIPTIILFFLYKYWWLKH